MKKNPVVVSNHRSLACGPNGGVGALVHLGVGLVMGVVIGDGVATSRRTGTCTH
jgi:hypothetical protein